MPIEELSHRTGVTVRNLRELQRRGLVPPPLLEGRKGLYTERHLARVMLVRNLQDRGHSLARVGEMLAEWTGSLGLLGVMGVEDGVATSGAGAQRRLSESELMALLPELRNDRKLVEGALEVELLGKDGAGRLFAPSAQMLETARALADAGIPFEVQLADFRVLRREIDVMTARFRARFQQYVVARLERDGMPASGMEELAARVARLRPAVVQGVAAVLSAAIERGGPISAPTPGPRKRRKER